MRRTIIIFAFLLISTCSLLAQEASLKFEQANQLYRNNDYRKAAQLYEEILRNGYESSALYFNLGNAYFKLQNIPAAILNYERARRLAPGDDDIQYNLRLANLRVVDRIDPVPQLFIISWWQSLIGLFSSDGWATVGLLGVWCVLACGAVFIVTRTPLVQRMFFFSAVAAILVCVIAGIGAVQRYRIEHSDQSAVVFATSTSVKSAPDPQSTDLFVLHEGVKVEFLDTVGDWRKIKLADGKIGWLQSSTVQVI